MTGTEIVPYDPERYQRDSRRVERGFWAKVRRTLGYVPFMEDLLAAYFCASDADTPLHVKAVLMGALAYFVLPLDWIPDFIAGIGYTDDAAVLAAAISTIAPHLKPRHYDRARSIIKSGRVPDDI